MVNDGFMAPHTNIVRNVNQALEAGLTLMTLSSTIKEASRNGPVSVWPGPVVTYTTEPMERVLFSPMRDANPFFHLFESLWMLGGRNDLPWLAQFNKQMADYSDDGGKTQPAAYGHRWRNFFGFDQIEEVVKSLRDHKTRRAVLAMWDGGGFRGAEEPFSGSADLMKANDGSADVPCNTHCYFTVRDGALHMGVMCRSNDILWGAHGANAVHFSILLEYIAAKCALAVGTMTQFSWNYHLYDDVAKFPLRDMASDAIKHDHYSAGLVKTTPLFESGTTQFDKDLPVFLDFAAPGASPTRAGFVDPFFKFTAWPMLEAWRLFKRADLKGAIGCCHDISGSDWKRACMEWMTRRHTALTIKRGGSV